jgi:primosomal protein N' (replication factor Y)
MSIARVALPVARGELFDYWVPAGLAVAPGSVVRVRLARRALCGVVVETALESAVEPGELQPIVEIVSGIALGSDLLALAAFASAYYQAPLGQVLALALPPLARTATLRPPRAKPWVAPAVVDVPPPSPNAEQRAAGEAIVAARGKFAPMLLHGVTGSGKTAVYLAAAEQAIAAGGQCLLLVPEINLTPQLLERVAAALPGRRAAAMHSGIPAAARRRAFATAGAGEVDILVGTRLAVFVPLPRLALIIVDEEHDASYKQQDGVRYHGRDVAIWRARQRAVPIVLGSATPSLETLLQAKRGRYAWLRLTRRAVVPARPPEVVLTPARDPRAIEGLCAPLVAAIEARRARGEQAMVFVNRRGFSPSLLCSACGWQAACTRCSARLVVHRDARELRCHHCNHAETLPRA